ncbi:MAG: hypothetical protein ACOZIN_11285, partial [Myxococcota bacterium]
MTARGVIAFACALLAASCRSCVGVADIADVCEGCGGLPVAVGDNPVCRHSVSSFSAGPTPQWEATGPSGGKVTSLLAASRNLILAGTGYVRG